MKRSAWLSVIGLALLWCAPTAHAGCITYIAKGVYVIGPYEFDPIDHIFFYSTTVSLDPTFPSFIEGVDGADIGTWSYDYTSINPFTGLDVGQMGIEYTLSSGSGIPFPDKATFQVDPLGSPWAFQAQYHNTADGSCLTCSVLAPEPGGLRLGVSASLSFAVCWWRLRKKTRGPRLRRLPTPA